ncbi:MAG: SOS response-associated peptidase [Anaerolineaceae bacterium]|nr:SOS response-associated peptidase [Anaerolineaceae bacterium]
MCARFTLILTPNGYALVYDFDTAFVTEVMVPRYNVAPTQNVAVVSDPETRRVQWMRWGLIPSWAKDPSIGNKMINARCETLAEKPSFRNAFQKRRCLILADGFYEWQQIPNGRSVPYYFTLKDHSPFVFAGLWESWNSPAGQPLQTCTIITCPPNELVAPIHDRMPVILNRQAADNWIGQTSSPQLQALLSAYPANQMQRVQVGPKVNNPAIESPDLIFPEQTLF